MDQLSIAVLIPYLDAIVNHDFDWLNNPDNVKDVELFLNQPLDEWDVIDEEPTIIYELLELSALINSMVEHSEDDVEVVSRFYQRHFGFAFIDVDPTVPLSVAGWINSNYSRQHEERYESLPSVSLFHVYEFVEELVKASPTMDETLPEHIVAVISEHMEQGDTEMVENYFFTDLNDHCFDLSKVVNIHGSKLLDTIDRSNADDLTAKIVEEISHILHETVETVLEDGNKSEHPYHAITILENSVTRLNEEVDSYSSK